MAQKDLYIQAYGITNNTIIKSIIEAKKRGIRVSMLLDRSNLYQRYSGLQQLKNEDIEVMMDNVPGIAHNKVMIIDQRKVITGSFNFTDAADTRNVENVVVIDDLLVAQKYLKNWEGRRAASREKYEG